MANNENKKVAITKLIDFCHSHKDMDTNDYLKGYTNTLVHYLKLL